jgi:hypothetical protein
MPSRTARWFALALVVFLIAQPIPFQAFGQDTSSECPCCKDMKCSMRSHGHTPPGDTSGPAFSSRDCCDQCQVSVRKTRPVAETFAPAIAFAELVPKISSPSPRPSWIPSAWLDVVLFERPPPSSF